MSVWTTGTEATRTHLGIVVAAVDISSGDNFALRDGGADVLEDALQIGTEQLLARLESRAPSGTVDVIGTRIEKMGNVLWAYGTAVI